MKILKISTIDNRGGGSKIPWNLMLEMIKRGHDVSMFVGWKHSNHPKVFEVKKNPFYYRLSKYTADDLHFSFSDSILKTKEYKEADIIHFHNIHSGFFNWSTFKKIVREKKAVWTTHDLWPITSGCTTTIGCETEKPLRVLGFLWDNRARMLKQKIKAYRDSKFYVAAPSKWISERIDKSIMSKMPKRIILNGIDTQIFKPLDRSQCRAELGMDKDSKIVLFIANGGLQNALKGGDTVLKIAKSMTERRDVHFVVVGNKKTDPIEGLVNTTLIGNIEDEAILAKYYSAADVVIYPTTADNCPLVLLESMACGTPAVSYRVDGVPEIIDNLGKLANQGDVQALKDGIDQIISMDTDSYLKLRKQCVARIQEHYSLKRMIDEYEDYYKHIISQPK